jgi:hypothetical protein
VEVVLLWLDDLDDMVFTVALAWESLRRLLLQIGLAAAFAIAGCELSATATDWVPALTGVAGASVAAWFLGALFRALYRRDFNDLPAAA